MRFAFSALPQWVTWRFEVLRDLLLLGGGCWANCGAVRPTLAGGGVSFCGLEVRETPELAGFCVLASFDLVFGRTFFGHGEGRCTTSMDEGGSHLGGPRGLGISRRKVSSPLQRGQVKGWGAGSSGGASRVWPRRWRRSRRFFLAAPAARP